MVRKEISIFLLSLKNRLDTSTHSQMHIQKRYIEKYQKINAYEKMFDASSSYVILHYSFYLINQTFFRKVSCAIIMEVASFNYI